MTINDALTLFGFFIIFLGLGLLIYTSLLGFLLRLHLEFFPEINSQLEQLQIQHHEPDSATSNHETTAP